MEIAKGETLVAIERAVTRMPETRFRHPVSWTVKEGEQWAIIGPNGAGKTLLTDLARGAYALRSGAVRYPEGEASHRFIKSIAFKDIYSLADCRDSYYQQRWHATEVGDNMPRVADLLEPYAHQDGYLATLRLFHLEELLPKRLIYLSSGELRKFLVIRALLAKPRILILDNPFIGLDAPSRATLVETLNEMSRLEGIQVILVLSNPRDIPEMITHVQPVEDRTLLPAMSRAAFLSDTELIARLFPTERAGWTAAPVELPINKEKEPSTHEVTLRMEHVRVRYGSRVILEDLDWEVRNGEKWALSGPNGVGKSTLLSLVYADNPQSYANTIYLFDRRRGTGESIWEIKRRIGYVSPEMHLYYQANVATSQIVGSGFFDSVGLFRKCAPEQEAVALAWMRVFGIEGLRDRLFQTLSSGEQRLALLARAFVKDPDLLILDEPLHGLDVSNKKRAAEVIDRFCERAGKTLIYVTHYPHELPRQVDKRFELVKHV